MKSNGKLALNNYSDDELVKFIRNIVTEYNENVKENAEYFESRRTLMNDITIELNKRTITVSEVIDYDMPKVIQTYSLRLDIQKIVQL